MDKNNKKLLAKVEALNEEIKKCDDNKKAMLLQQQLVELLIFSFENEKIKLKKK